MTLLVTGATGFVGSAITRRLLDAGERVRVLVRPTSDRRNLEGLDVEVAEGDLLEATSLERALEGCTGLYHAAADYRLWSPRPQELYDANVNGTKNIFRAALKSRIKRIVYTSSVATLGIRSDEEPANEDTPVSLADMIGPYKRSKFLAEEEVRRLVRDEALPAVIVNPSAPIGPRDIKPTPTGRMIVEAASGRMPGYVDTGLNVVHVDDVAHGHLLAFERGKIGERYILGGHNMPLGEILSAITKAAGRRPPRFRLPHGLVLPVAYLSELWARMSGTEPFATVDGIRMARKKMYFSSEKAQHELGYRARPAGESFRDAIGWFREKGYLD